MTLEPGQELDAMVAKALDPSVEFIGLAEANRRYRETAAKHDRAALDYAGYPKTTPVREAGDYYVGAKQYIHDPACIDSVRDIPPYSTDANCAIEAADAVGLFDNWLIGKDEDGWYFQDHSERGMPGVKDQQSFAVAICIAILAVKENP